MFASGQATVSCPVDRGCVPQRSLLQGNGSS